MFQKIKTRISNWYTTTSVSLKFLWLLVILVGFLTVGYASFVIVYNKITFTPISSIQNKIDERFINAVRESLDEDHDLQQFNIEINLLIEEYNNTLSDVADPDYGVEQCWSVNGTQKAISIHTTDFEKLEKLQVQFEVIQQKSKDINNLLTEKLKSNHTLLSRFASSGTHSLAVSIVNWYSSPIQLMELNFKLEDSAGKFGRLITSDGKCSLVNSVSYTEADMIDYFKLTPWQDEFIKVEVTREFPVESVCNEGDDFVRSYLNENNFDERTKNANGMWEGYSGTSTCHMYYNPNKLFALVYFSNGVSKEGSESFSGLEYYLFKIKDKSYTKLENFPPYEIGYLELPSFKIGDSIIYIDIDQQEVKNIFFTYDFDKQSRKYIDFETNVNLDNSGIRRDRGISPRNFLKFSDDSFDGSRYFCQETFGLFTLPTDPDAYYIQLFKLPNLKPSVSQSVCDNSENNKYLMRFKLSF